MRPIADLRRLAQSFGADHLTIPERCAIAGVKEWTDLPPEYHEAAGRAVGTNIYGHIVQTKEGPVALTNTGRLALKRLGERTRHTSRDIVLTGAPHHEVLTKGTAVIVLEETDTGATVLTEQGDVLDLTADELS